MMTSLQKILQQEYYIFQNKILLSAAVEKTAVVSFMLSFCDKLTARGNSKRKADITAVNIR